MEILGQGEGTAGGEALQQARVILAESIARSPDDVNTWWLLALMAETPQEQRLYLRHVLSLDHDHNQARILLERCSLSAPSAAQTIKELLQARIATSQLVVRSAKDSNGNGIPVPFNRVVRRPADGAVSPSIEVGHPASEAKPVPMVPTMLIGLEQSSGDANSYPMVYPSKSIPGTIQADTSIEVQEGAIFQTSGPDALDNYAIQAEATTAAPTLPTLLPWWRTLQLSDQSRYQETVQVFALAYLAIITIAELLTVFISVRVGIVLHVGALLLLFVHTVRRRDYPDHRLWVSLALVPLIRIISLSLPLANFSLTYWFLFTSIPLFAAALLVMRLLNLSWREVGLTLDGLPLQLLIAPIGLVLGYVEHRILQPEALVSELTVRQMWWPALILLISTGLLEELIFRGIMQSTAVETLGRMAGVVYVAVYFAVLHVGYRSLVDAAFVLAVGLLFGWIVLRTKSIIGVTLAHGLTNITLFLLVPILGNIDLAQLLH